MDSIDQTVLDDVENSPVADFADQVAQVLSLEDDDFDKPSETLD